MQHWKRSQPNSMEPAIMQVLFGWMITSTINPGKNFQANITEQLGQQWGIIGENYQEGY